MDIRRQFIYDTASTPVASFTTSPTPATGDIPLTVAFTDTSTNSPTSWLWTIVGGTENVDYVFTVGSATSQNPTIRFDLPTTYTVTLTATNASGSDASNPATITAEGPPLAGYSYWFRANGLVAGVNNIYGVADGSGNISETKDLGDSIITSTQVAGIQQPLLVSGVIGTNLRKCIRFDGSNDDLVINNADTLTNNAGGATIFFVGKTRTGGSLQFPFFINNGSALGSARFSIDSSAANAWELRVRRLDADGAGVLAGGSSTSAFKIVCGVMDWTNGDGFIYENRALVNSNNALTSSGSTSATNSLVSRLGELNTGNNWAGDAGDYLFYPFALTQAQVEAVSDWMNEFYGIY